MAPPLIEARPPPPALAPWVAGITAYVEHGRGLRGIREPASLDVPVIVSLAGAFRVALDRPPAASDRVTSFAAGLHPGFVAMDSDGLSACIQIDFTPPGARLALGLPLDALAGRMVPLDDLGLADLAARMADLPGWPERLRLAESWAARRIAAGLADRPPEARAVHAAYDLLRRSHGRPRVTALADHLGWSRKRLAAGFRTEIGLAPKPLARILRFRRALALAAAGRPDWADIAAACGYADQPHLVREFHTLAGTTPAAWAAGRG